MFTLSLDHSFLVSSLILVSASAGVFIGCSNKSGVEGDDNTAGGSTSYIVNNQGGSNSYVAGQGGSGTAGAGGDTSTGVTAMPWPPSTDYTNVTNVTSGAYALGPNISDGIVPANTGTTCQGMLFGVLRDFQMGTLTGGHPDFQTAPSQDVRGIVGSTLGTDGKPVYANPDQPPVGTSGQTNFDQWYRDAPGINMTYIVALKLVTSNGISTFSASINNGNGLADSSYFPLDNAGFGNQDQSHNFSFTTEIHTSFVYHPGDTFTFVGDDDVWVFINNQLAIDLGGRHAQESAAAPLDSLGLTAGATYPLDVFNAERHTSQSNFRIDTTLTLANCGQINGIIIN